MYDTSATYYIPEKCIKTESGSKTPYGDFTEVYVGVTYNGKGYDYYWISNDTAGQGIKNIVSYKKLDTNLIESDVKDLEIKETIDKTGIDGRKTIIILNDNCSNWDDDKIAYNLVSKDGTIEIIKIPICKRAVSLHTAECLRSSRGCFAAGYNLGETSNSKNTKTITFGSLGTSGVLKVGDAFDCDVNGDGVYDSETERFYFVSYYYDTNTNTFDNSKISLLYYASMKNGVVSYDISSYSNSNVTTYLGPNVAYTSLPSKNVWSNTKLIIPNHRIIQNERGTKKNGTKTIRNPFDYKDKAARLLTYQELINGCGTEILSSVPSKCNSVWENIAEYLGLNVTLPFGSSIGIRLETVSFSDYLQSWQFWCYDNNLKTYDSK